MGNFTIPTVLKMMKPLSKHKGFGFVLLMLTFLMSSSLNAQIIPATDGAAGPCGDCAPAGWVDITGTPDVSDANIVSGPGGGYGAGGTWNGAPLPLPPNGHTDWITIRDVGTLGTEEKIGTTLSSMVIGRDYELIVYTMSSTSNPYGPQFADFYQYQLQGQAEVSVAPVTQNVWRTDRIRFQAEAVNRDFSFTPGSNMGSNINNLEPINLSITLNAINAVPVADNNSVLTNFNTPITFNAVSTDVDYDGSIDVATVDLDPATAGVQQGPIVTAEGTWTVDALGDVTFTPAPGFLGVATLPYVVNDDYVLDGNNVSATSNVAFLSVTVSLDSDGDGIPDSVDLDDDNDGISDAEENNCDTDTALFNNEWTYESWSTVGPSSLGGDSSFTFAQAGFVANGDGTYTFDGTTVGEDNVVDSSGSFSNDISGAANTQNVASGVADLDFSATNSIGEVSEMTTFATFVPGAAVSFNLVDDQANDTFAYAVLDTEGNVLVSDNPGYGTNVRVENISIVAPANGVVEIKVWYFDPSGVFSVPQLEMSPNPPGLVVNSSLPCNLDTDNDGVPNSLDLDSDNDGILDIVESGQDAAVVDANNNGILDSMEGGPNPAGDSNGDGIADAVVAGADPIDSDGDGIDDYFDSDSDNDGIADVIEAGGTDANADGYADDDDNNVDNTGSNGIPTSAGTTGLTPPNSDGAGGADYIDIDADNDGIPDSYEAQDPTTTYVAPTGNDTDGDGLDDAYDTDNGGLDLSNPQNTDANGNPDYIDIDADNDGIVDNIEGQSSVGYQLPDADTDGNGLADVYETTPGSGILVNQPEDTDSDGTPDYADLDSDGDGISDTIEAYDTDGDDAADTTPSGLDGDNDGLDDNFDLETGGAGMQDPNGSTNDGQIAYDFPNDQDAASLEVDFRDDETPATPVPDTDGDGIADDVDIDDDNDGILDSVESLGFTPSTIVNDPSCTFPSVSFSSPTQIVDVAGDVGDQYRFDNIATFPGVGVVDAIVEVTEAARWSNFNYD